MGQKKSSELYNVAYNYHYGIGVEKDGQKAFIYYQKSAKMGSAGGTFHVGNCYRNGIGVYKDEHKAFVYYQKSAEMGYAIGIFFVGYCYHYGFGVEKDEHKAFIYYQKSAEMRYNFGIYMVGYCYQNGIGVEKNEHKAFIYYQKSAKMGYGGGVHNVGRCYRKGIGVEKDEHKAFLYYQKAADMKNEVGMCGLGDCHKYGIGVEINLKKAFELYLKSAEMGHIEGMKLAGYCYRNGIGTKKDLKEAEYWFKMERSRFQEIKKYLYSEIDNDAYFRIDDNVKKILDDEKYQLLWIPYSKFENIKLIGKGGFATVYRADCLLDYDNSHYKHSFVFKIIHGQDFFDELKAFCEIGYKNPSFLKCYGLSKDDSGNYILILKYAEKGSLRDNLYEVSQMKWEKKLNLLSCIASDLEAIHSQGLEHRDLHSGNILQDDLDNAYITDLGLSSTKKGVYGVLPYMAPEILQKKTIHSSS